MFTFILGPNEFNTLTQADVTYANLDTSTWATVDTAIEYEYDVIHQLSPFVRFQNYSELSYALKNLALLKASRFLNRETDFSNSR